jgi:hypothetical protein
LGLGALLTYHLATTKFGVLPCKTNMADVPMTCAKLVPCGSV